MSDRLLDAAEAAHRLKVRPRTLYKWIARGEIGCVRMGRIVRFRPEDVDRWILDRIAAVRRQGRPCP